MSPHLGLRRRITLDLLGIVANWLIGLYYATIHFVNDPEAIRILNRTPQPRGIYPFWHSHQLSALNFYRQTHAAILVSRSRDGEYIARIAARAGFVAVRGSSSRGGAQGMREMVRAAAAGHPLAITPDGPRGPRHAVHLGVLGLARTTRLPITPVAFGLSSFWELPSWDRFRIPKPFSTACACWGRPLHVPPDADEAELQHLAQELQQRMTTMEQQADRLARQLHRHRGRVDPPLRR